jgi:hypothetical protein
MLVLDTRFSGRHTSKWRKRRRNSAGFQSSDAVFRNSGRLRQERAQNVLESHLGITCASYRAP